MDEISVVLRKEATDAFETYERRVCDVLLKKPGWRLNRAPLQATLNSSSAKEVRRFIEEMRIGCDEVEDAIVLRSSHD